VVLCTPLPTPTPIRAYVTTACRCDSHALHPMTGTALFVQGRVCGPPFENERSARRPGQEDWQSFRYAASHVHFVLPLFVLCSLVPQGSSPPPPSSLPPIVRLPFLPVSSSPSSLLYKADTKLNIARTAVSRRIGAHQQPHSPLRSKRARPARFLLQRREERSGYVTERCSW
jgi:hypothetical protein